MGTMVDKQLGRRQVNPKFYLEETFSNQYRGSPPSDNFHQFERIFFVFLLGEKVFLSL
jgi:hypothetical protein